jgi:hypothetical protein
MHQGQDERGQQADGAGQDHPGTDAQAVAVAAPVEKADRRLAPPLAGAPALDHHPTSPGSQEVAMAKGQIRVAKEKKKPKADKSKPKQLTPYKLAQMQDSHTASPYATPPVKKL